MNLEKLSKQLKRDLAANPGKASFLALLAAVAVWYWSPLLMKVFRSLTGRATPPAAAHPETAAPAPPTSGPSLTTGQAPPTAVVAPVNWDAIRENHRSDRLTKSAKFDASWHNPFAIKQIVSAPAQTADATPGAETIARENAVEVAPVDPVEAGLRLESIIIGPRSRKVMLNGRMYSEGDTIQRTVNSNLHEYQIVVIERRSIVLLSGAQSFELKVGATTASNPISDQALVQP